MRQERPPFSRSLSHSTRPPFQHSSVPQDLHFNQKLQNFPIFRSKGLYLANFQFLFLKSVKIQNFKKPHFGSKISFESYILFKKKKKKIISTSPQIWGWSVLQGPIFCSSWTPPSKPKLSTPSGLHPRLYTNSYTMLLQIILIVKCRFTEIFNYFMQYNVTANFIYMKSELVCENCGSVKFVRTKWIFKDTFHPKLSYAWFTNFENGSCQF